MSHKIHLIISYLIFTNHHDPIIHGPFCHVSLLLGGDDLHTIDKSINQLIFLDSEDSYYLTGGARTEFVLSIEVSTKKCLCEGWCPKCNSMQVLPEYYGLLMYVRVWYTHMCVKETVGIRIKAFKEVLKGIMCHFTKSVFVVQSLCKDRKIPISTIPSYDLLFRKWSIWCFCNLWSLSSGRFQITLKKYWNESK